MDRDGPYVEADLHAIDWGPAGALHVARRAAGSRRRAEVVRHLLAIPEAGPRSSTPLFGLCKTAAAS
jgi:hypothetical protein